MSIFTLTIDTSKASISNRFDEPMPSLETMEENRRRGVASLLRTVALMLEQGRNVEKIRDHNGCLCGHYELRH